MVYPTFTIDTKAINIASSYGYSPYFDIVWSFDYAISGNSNTEAGFTIFLLNDSYTLSGGNNGIDLGYSGLSAINGSLGTVKPGISGAIIAVGFDTTGSFAVSALSGTRLIRDGVADASRIPNSVGIRGGWPSYSYNTYKYNQALSSIDSTFKIVENSVKYKTIRARLGNVGQTLYVDYRNSPEENFKTLVSTNVNLNITSTTKYKAGISFATPVSGNNINKVGNIYIRNFHTEGSAVSGNVTSIYVPVTAVVPAPTTITITEPPTILPIPAIPNVIVAIEGSTDSLCHSTRIADTRLTAADNGTGLTEDAYNFGYKINVTGGSFYEDIFTRSSMFSYYSVLSDYRIYKNYFYSKWILSGSSLFVTNSSYTPNGTYNSTITATYI